MVVTNRGRKRTYSIHEEVIEFTKYPIWEQQELETPDWFERFRIFYLPIPSGYRTLNRAYSNCGEASGERIEKTKFKRAKTVPDDWQLAHKNYRWEERAKAYWLLKIQEQQAYTDSILREIREKTLKITLKNLEKIEQMTSYPISRRRIDSVDESGRPIAITIEPNGNWSHKDAVTMAKTLTDTFEKVLSFDTIEYAINIVQKHGLAVIDPNGKLIGHSDTGKPDDGLTSIIRDSAEFDDNVMVPTRISDNDESE